MLMCTTCGKRPRKIAWSRHKKGSSGATEWPLRAQVTKRLQKPNLHMFKTNKYCTKCLRIIKPSFSSAKVPLEQVQVTP